MDASGMLRIISEQTLDTDEKLYACFIDGQNAFDCVNWTKLMQILKGTGTDGCKRKVIKKLHMDLTLN